jgi:hypothetical protein
MFSKQLKKIVSVLCLACVLSPVSAEEPSSLSIRGFGTLGVARSSSADAEFIRDLSQPKGIKDGEWSSRLDTVLGVQANWQASSDLEFVAQLVSRYQYDGSRDPKLDWAFLKWMPDDRTSIRVGRIGADVMMLADSRSVGYSYVTVRPSVDFFGSVFFSSFDGADISLTLPLGNGLIRSKVLGGLIQEKATGAPGIWDTSGSKIHGLVVDYFLGNWQFRGSYHGIRLSNDLNFTSLTTPLYGAALATGISSAKVAADVLGAEDTNSRYYSLGVVYDNGPLQIQAAVNKINHETATFQNSQAAYLLAAYRSDTLTPFAGVSRWTTNYKDYSTGLPDIPLFAPLNQGYQSVMNASGANQTTYTIGLRWDVWSNIALKLQWDAVRGNEDSKFPYANADTGPNWDGHTDVTSVTMDFIF